MIMRPNYALKLTSAATAAPLIASVLRGWSFSASFSVR